MSRVDHRYVTIDCEDVVPQFVSSYLRIAGDECAFIDTNTAHSTPKLLAALSANGLSTDSVRWIVTTHAHLDHAGGASAMMALCPNATLLAHPRAARHLIDPSKLVASATQVYGAERFAALYGVIAPIEASRVRALDDGEAFALADATLHVHHTAGHAKHHFIVDDPATRTVFTGDTFGLVYPALQRGVRFAFPSTSPTDFDPAEARKSVACVLACHQDIACPTHFGPVRDQDEVARQVLAWIDRAEEWMLRAASTDAPVAQMTQTLAQAWRDAMDADARSRGLALTAADWQLLSLDIDLNAQGIAFVADKLRAAKA